MEELFRLVRLPLLPLPLALWTLLWPLLLAGIVVVAIPVKFVGTTLIYAVGLPFIFFGAAYSNEPTRVSRYLDEWRRTNEKTMSMASEIKVARGYSRILAWGNDPKAVPDTGWTVGTANVIGVLLIGAVVSEMVRIAVAVLLAIIVILIGLTSG